jgi:hypothetical protein
MGKTGYDDPKQFIVKLSATDVERKLREEEEDASHRTEAR